MDAINPQHYRQGPIECIELIRDLPFSQGAAIKYLWRLGMKDDIDQELDKARWFIRDCIDNDLYGTPDELLLALVKGDTMRGSAIRLVAMGKYERALGVLDAISRGVVLKSPTQ